MYKIFLILVCFCLIGCKTSNIHPDPPDNESNFSPSDIPDEKPRPDNTITEKPNNNNLFIQAVRANDLSEANRILSLSPGSLNFRDNTGKTGLIHAVENGNRAIVEMLLNKGANPDVADSRGMTALIYCMQKNNTVIADILLNEKYGVNVNFQTTGQRNTALHYAVESNNASFVKLLLENKTIQTQLTDINGETAFFTAVKKNYRPLIRLFGQLREFDVTVKNNDGIPAFLLGIQSKVDVGTIQEILSYCKEAMNSTDSNGKGPYEYLASSNYSDRDKQRLNDMFVAAEKK